MTLQRSGGAAAFSESAEAYAATMAPSLRVMAQHVVDRARLGPGEVVVDLGTGTGTAAGLARGEGRRVIGLDAAPGMLDIARSELADVELVEASFDDLPFDDASIDVVLAVHALLFADDRAGVLGEWLRVTRPGGRLSLSVPGPGDVVPSAVFGEVYDRYDIEWGNDYPVASELTGWAEAAGWSEIETDADPSTAIVLADDALFRTWLTVGARGRATKSWSEERREQFFLDLMAAAPCDADGAYRLPFGSLYLTARVPIR